MAKDSGGKLSYADAVKDREKIEEKIGLSLAKNAMLTNIAAKITKNVGARSYNQLGKPSQGKIDGEVDTFGGARAFKEGWGTLGASVFAVMNEIEQDSATKTHYSKVQEGNTENPYFGKPGEKKPEFDKPFADLKWAELPYVAKIALDDHKESPFKKLPPSTYDELDFKGKLTLLKAFRYNNKKANATANILNNKLRDSLPQLIKDALAILSADDSDQQQKKDARTQLRQEIRKVMTGDSKEDKAKLSAFLDIVVDRHTSGDNTNIVQFDKDKEGHVINNEKNQWIKDTVKAGKPIISGPSGHTLRYLNFWAEKRQEEKNAGGNINDWPSLEAARLVMMANLMPPKHHSYDEVMTASIGIKDEVSDALTYEHKSSYEDLNEHTNDAKGIAQTAYTESGANTITTNTHLENSIQKDITARNTLQQRKAELQTALNTATEETKIQKAIDALR